MRWEGPFIVKEKKGNVNYRIASPDGKKLMVVHADRMKKFHGQATPIVTNEPTTQKVQEKSLPVDENKSKGKECGLRRKVQMPVRFRD